MEEKKLVIVLFEDKEEEIQKVREIVEKTKGVTMSNFVFQTLEDAGFFFDKKFRTSHVSPEAEDTPHLEEMKKSVTIKSGYGYLGILTDLFMPPDIGVKEEEPVGVAIAVAAKMKGLPVVVCTGGGHPHTHWTESILDILGIPVNYEKDWEKAIRLLREQAQ